MQIKTDQKICTLLNNSHWQPSDFSLLQRLRYGVQDRPIAARFQAGTRDLSLLKDAYTRPAAHSDSNPSESGGLFPKTQKGVRLAS